MNELRVFIPVVNADPHLSRHVSLHASDTTSATPGSQRSIEPRLTFLNVLRPAKMLPPIHVLYLRSGGAKILMRMSLMASRCSSCSSRSPKPRVSVEPPDSTMLPNSDLRRSMSVREMASTIIWCTPGYSSPMISGSKRISGARKRSDPTCASRQRGWFDASVPLSAMPSSCSRPVRRIPSPSSPWSQRCAIPSPPSSDPAPRSTSSP